MERGGGGSASTGGQDGPIHGDEAILAHHLIDALSVVRGTLATLRTSRTSLDDHIVDELLDNAERKAKLVIDLLRGSITAGSTGALILLSGAGPAQGAASAPAPTDPAGADHGADDGDGGDGDGEGRARRRE